MTERSRESGETSSAAGSVETELSRDMSLFDVTFIGVGAMIGAGVFALTGYAAGIAGPALTVVFVLNGFVALFTAVSYAELGAAFPEAGGGYLWVKEALVDPNGFFAGWMSWFAHAVACALYAVTFGVFLTEFFVVFGGAPEGFVLFGVLDRLLVEKLVAVLVVLGFAYVNYRGAEETGKAGVVVTGIKLAVLAVFVAFGLAATAASPSWPSTFLASPSFAPHGVSGIIGAMGFTYIAFEGYEIIVQSGEEVESPGRNVPKAVFYSLAIVIPVYVLVAFAAIGGIDVTGELAARAGLSAGAPTWQVLGGLGELGIIEAAGQFVPYGVPLLLVAGLAATTSALNATVYSSSRVSFAMGRDRVLPGIFDRIHPERRTPHWAIALSTVLVVAMAVTLPIESVAAAADLMFILLFVQVNWTVVKMRRTHPDLPRTFEIPFMPWPPLIGIGLQVLLTPFLLVELGLQPGVGPGSEGFMALVTTVVWMALGLVVYVGYARGKEAEKLEEAAPTVVAERAPERRESQILVPIGNPDTAPQLMRTAIDLAREWEAEILVMAAVTVPQQTPLSEGRRFVERRREVLEAALAQGEEAEVPVSGTIRIGHSVPEAILNTVEQEGSDVVLLGWRGRGRRRDHVLGSTIDEVVTTARADVLVERIGPAADGVDSILLPTAGGPHADLAAVVSRAIARTTGARVDVVNVVPPDATEEERARARERVDRTAAGLEGVDSVDLRLLEGDDVVTAIVEASEDHDVTIVGATREGLFQQLVFGAIPEEVGRRAANTVIMTKRDTGVISWVSRWFRSHRPDRGGRD